MNSPPNDPFRTVFLALYEKYTKEQLAVIVLDYGESLYLNGYYQALYEKSPFRSESINYN